MELGRRVRQKSQQGPLAIRRLSAYAAKSLATDPWLQAPRGSEQLALPPVTAESKVGAQHPKTFWRRCPRKTLSCFGRISCRSTWCMKTCCSTPATSSIGSICRIAASSLVVGLADGQSIEAAMVGRDSLVGGSAALDGGVAFESGHRPGRRDRIDPRRQNVAGGRRPEHRRSHHADPARASPVRTGPAVRRAATRRTLSRPDCRAGCCGRASSPGATCWG